MTMQAKVVDDIESEEGRAPGAIDLRLAYRDDDAMGIAARCPCGCGEAIYLPITDGPARSGGIVSHWHWDGNQIAPTLSPSVYNTGLPCKWHGYLRSGEWVPA
jgi:hypothetical protein